MIAFLFSPIGRYVAIGLVVFMAASGIYYKIRADAIAEIEAQATADAIRRMQNAVNAGDAVDVSADGGLFGVEDADAGGDRVCGGASAKGSAAICEDFFSDGKNFVGCAECVEEK